MYRMQLGFALAAAIGAGGWWTPGQELASLQVAQDAAAPADLPPLASLVGDPAELAPGEGFPRGAIERVRRIPH